MAKKADKTSTNILHTKMSANVGTRRCFKIEKDKKVVAAHNALLNAESGGVCEHTIRAVTVAIFRARAPMTMHNCGEIED